MTINPKKIVCVFAHPDDEAFGPGGTIAHFAKDCDVTIICVTNGDADPQFAKGNDTSTLGEVRREELKNSAEILGVGDVIFLDFKDGSLNNNNYHQVTAKLEPILKDIKPDTLMTFGQSGLTGHLDHIAVSMETTYLFERLDFVKTLMYFCNRDESKKIVGLDYFVYFPEGLKESEADLVVDVEPYMETMFKAMEAHKSQIDDYVWVKENFGKLLNKEYFKVLQK